MLLLCDTFGNLTDAGGRATVEAALQLCAPGTEMV
jgi:hypothetical protein